MEKDNKLPCVQGRPNDRIYEKDICIINSYVRNSTTTNYWVDGDDAFPYNCRSYSDDNRSHEWDTDYMFTTYYGHRMVWRKLYAEKVGSPAHTGHGFTFKSSSDGGSTFGVFDSLNRGGDR